MVTRWLPMCRHAAEEQSFFYTDPQYMYHPLLPLARILPWYHSQSSRWSEKQDKRNPSTCKKRTMLTKSPVMKVPSSYKRPLPLSSLFHFTPHVPNHISGSLDIHELLLNQIIPPLCFLSILSHLPEMFFPPTVKHQSKLPSSTAISLQWGLSWLQTGNGYMNAPLYTCHFGYSIPPADRWSSACTFMFPIRLREPVSKTVSSSSPSLLLPSALSCIYRNSMKA